MTSDNPTLSLLRRCPLFAGAEPEDLQDVVSHLRRRRFRRGEVIFHEGDPADALHVVAAGSVKIVLSSDEGDEAIIATLHPGDFFGELSLLDGSPRSATAAAVEAAETLSLRDTFLEALGRSAGLRDALLRSLAGELRRLTATSRSSTSSTSAGGWRAAWHLARDADSPPRRAPRTAISRPRSNGPSHNRIWLP